MSIFILRRISISNPVACVGSIRAESGWAPLLCDYAGGGRPSSAGAECAEIALKSERKPSGSCRARLSAAFAPFFTSLSRLGGVLATVQPPLKTSSNIHFGLADASSRNARMALSTEEAV